MMAAAPSVNNPPVSARRIIGNARSIPAYVNAQTVSAINNPFSGP